MEVISKIVRLRAVVEDLRRRHATVALVPTMGGIHAGHLSLVAVAKERGAEVIASIFVNPRQFGEGEDFAAYPRDLTRDCQVLAKARVGAVFAPEVAEMYPDGYATNVEVARLSDVLIGASRPGHFRGVATVVLKLLNVVRPDLVVFGMKDAQQLVIVQRMVRDLALDVEVVPAPTVRDEDGLALSSRHAFLDEGGREAARLVYKSLQEAMRVVDEGERQPAVVEAAVRGVLAGDDRLEVDHVKVVDSRDLSEPRRLAGLVLALVAVRVQMAGRPPVLLTDNVRIAVPDEA